MDEFENYQPPGSDDPFANYPPGGVRVPSPGGPAPFGPAKNLPSNVGPGSGTDIVPQPSSTTPLATATPNAGREYLESRSLPQVWQDVNDVARTTGNVLGIGDRLASMMPTWAGGTGRTLAEENALSDAARARLGWGAVPAEMAGYAALPVGAVGRLAASVPEAVTGASLIPKSLMGRIAASALEGGSAGGITAANRANGDVLGGAVQGAAVGGAIPVAMGALSKAAGALPSWAGGKPIPLTTADLNTVAAGGNFDAANLSRVLDAVQYNKEATGAPISTQVSALLRKDPATGWRPLDNVVGADFEKDNPDAFAALKKAANPAPVASFMTSHPFIAGHALGIPVGVASFLSGAPLHEAAMSEVGVGEAGHLAAYLGASKLKSAAENSALQDVRRTIAGQPTTGPVQSAVNSQQARDALRSLLFGGAMGY